MPQLIVRKLEPAIVTRLRRRAAKQGISVEEAHRQVLRESLLGAEFVPKENFIQYLQSMPAVELSPRRERDLPRKLAL